jgi:hypothetical protein
MRIIVAALLSLWTCAFALEASAQSRCRVMDPTGTPLNVRTGPNGAVVASLPNGLLVSIKARQTDARGRAWVLIARYENDRVIGWVFREFIACF